MCGGGESVFFTLGSLFFALGIIFSVILFFYLFYILRNLREVSLELERLKNRLKREAGVLTTIVTIAEKVLEIFSEKRSDKSDTKRKR